MEVFYLYIKKSIKMKKFAGIIFSLCFVLISQAQTPDVWDGTSDTTWYNTTDTLFQLTTAEQLAGLAVMVNNGNSFQGKTIELMNDIDLGGALETPLNWTPIGYYYSHCDSICYEVYRGFNGVFEGNNKTISNLVVNDNDTMTLGFFGFSYGAIIRNIYINNVSFSIPKGKYCGGLIGACKYTYLLNCNVQTSLLFDYIKIFVFGGIAGKVDTSIIENCSFSGKIQGDSASYLSGIACFVKNSSISNCYVIADLEGSSVGGITQISQGGHLFNCFFAGNIYGIKKGYSAGLIGYSNGYDTIENCFAITSLHSCLEEILSEYGNFHANQQYGGLIGGQWGGTFINNCYIIGGIISGYSDLGGISGICNGRINNCYAATYTNGKIDVGSMIGFDMGFGSNQSFIDILLSTNDPIGYKYYENKEPNQLFTEEMTSGESFGLLNNTGNCPSQWVYKEGLYPQLDVFANHPDTIFRQASLLSVIPIFLGEQTANQIRNDFKVSTLYGVSWTSSAEDIIRIEGENAIVNPINQDTMIVLTVTLNNLQKEFYVKVIEGNDIKEVNTNKINLYPNPSNNQFTLDNGQELIKEVALYDVMGRKVQHLTVNAFSTTVNVSDLPNGIYVVKINTASEVIVRKVQIMR